MSTYQEQIQKRSNVNISKIQKKGAKRFDIGSISQIDNLLTKNEQIYKNLRLKLEGIERAQKNITNNINYIRPISYRTCGSKGQLYQIKQKYFNESSSYIQQKEYTENIENYTSSPIQTQRIVGNQQLRKRITQNQQNHLVNTLTSLQQQVQSIQSRTGSVNPSSQFKKPQQFNNYNNLSKSYLNINKAASITQAQNEQQTHQYENKILSSSYMHNESNNNNHQTNYYHLRNSSSSIFQKQKQNYYRNSYMNQMNPINQMNPLDPMNRSMPINFSLIESMNFSQVPRRKQEIQRIYKQLRQEQQEIQQAYQEYRKNYISEHLSSVRNQTQNNSKNMSSPPKNSQTKKMNFSKKKLQQSLQSLPTSKMSTIQKGYNNSSLLKENSSNPNLSNPNINLNNTQKTIEISLNQEAQFTQVQHPNPIYQKQSTSFYPLPSSLQQKSFLRYCTQQFSLIQSRLKPQPMSATSHIFIPFNKLYKSPIIQMKNQNTLVLARQSKILQHKTNQHKIVDGKKYKFPTGIQTDQQSVVKSILNKDSSAFIAIVGGQTTLKKKIHMTIIAHSFDKMLRIIYSKEYNFLKLTVSYCELIEKNTEPQVKIENSIEITEESSMKVSILQIQKTIEQIYEKMKKSFTIFDSTYNRNPSSFNQSQISKSKLPLLLRFTKLSLQSGKQYIESCHILSTNQYNYDFIKNLEVKDIIWSINPLIKYYQDVVKTLIQATRYNQAK